MYNRSAYDTALICRNGHVINSYSHRIPSSNSKFCTDCGAATIDKCEHCGTEIRGADLDTGGLIVISVPVAPRFCHECGKPYGWTEAKIQAARELAKEFGLEGDDLESFGTAIDDLIKDSPGTQVAAVRFKRFVGRMGTGAAGMFREVLVDVMSETAKKILYP